MSNSMKIKLKKVISPSEFYFQFLEEGEFKKEQDRSRIQVTKIERQLKNSRILKCQNPQIGEIVACHMTNWNRKVRAKVIGYGDMNNYKLLLIDYGIPMFRRDLYTIPDEMKIELHHVQRGSLGLNLPDRWSEQALKLCDELNSLVDSDVHFITICKKKDVFFGDIFVRTSSLGSYSVTDRLKSIDRSCESETNFDKIFQKMTNSSYPKPLIPREKIKIEPQLSLGSISDILFKENSFVPPLHFIIHGENLKSSWSSINDSLFNQNIKKEISKEISDVASYVWPQIHSSYRHTIIINSNEPELSSLFLPPLLNNIIQNPCRRNRSEFMGPFAIIFAHNSNKVKEIVKMSKSIVNDLKIIEAVGLCGDKKSDLIQGCDILVTTIPAFNRLTENISLRLIDVNRLRYVAFNEYDLMTKYENDINRIAKFCLADRERIPQILITSRVLSNDIKKKFLLQLPTEKTVICIDNFLEAATYAGIEIKSHTCDSFEKKVELLMEDGIKENTMIIVKDEKSVELLKEALTCNKFDVSTISIATDSLIENSCFENLIHFSLPKSQKIFMDRFKLMTSKIYEKLKGKEVKLTAKIFFEEDNVIEFESFMRFMVTRKLVKGDLEILDKIKFNRETVKCEKKIQLCSKLLQLGKCNDNSCTGRHTLCENDKFDCFIGDFVKFDVISVTSPINFVIKIKEFCKNGKWLSYETKKEILNDELQKYCEENPLNHLTIGEGKIGSVYAKFDEKLKKWVRVKLIERTPSTIVKIYLMDLGLTVHANESQLRKLTNNFSSIPPMMHKLQVIDLIPLDGQLYYDQLETQSLQAVIKKLSKNLTFICKIQFAFNDTLFTKNVEAKNSKNAIKFHLKFTHLQLGLSEVDESIGVKLKELLEGGNNQNAPNSSLIQSKCPPTLVKAFDTKHAIENWKELKYGKNISFTLRHYESPSSFFIITENSENFVLKNWLIKIEKFATTDKLVDFSIGNTCLALINDVNKRAKILSIEGDQAKLLLVDFGEVINAEKGEVFKLPDELSTLSFQAIHCSILGIKPKFNMNFWPSMQKSRIKSLIETNDWSMKIIKKNSNQHEFSQMGVNSYQVFLFDKNSDEYFHDIAVEKFYADVDKSIVDLLNVDSSDKEEEDELEDDESETAPSISDSGLESHQSKSESDSSDLQPSFNVKGLQSIATMFEWYKKSVDAEFSKENSPCISEAATSGYFSSQLSCDSSVPTFCEKAQLTSLFRHPHIEWRQNEVYLYLLIKAQDCKDYSVEIDEFSADLIIEYPEKSCERVVLQFYGSIIPQLCSHELTGANIILRFVKRKENVWPRLSSQEKLDSAYIKFSEENVPFIPITINQETPKFTGHPGGYYSDEEDDDKNFDGKEFQSISDDE